MTHKIDTDGRDVGLGVGVIGKSQKQARLSNTGISDEEELEEIVVSEKAVHVRKMSSRNRIPTPEEGSERDGRAGDGREGTL